MKKRVLVLLAAAVLVSVLFAGCDITVGGGETYDVKIVNNCSSAYFDDINIVDFTSTTWGDDQMISDTTLWHGSSVTLSGVSGVSTPNDISVRAQGFLLGVKTYERRGDNLDITQSIYITDSGITN